MALFGTAGIRGPVTDTLPPERASSIARAVGLVARENGDDTVAVGRDGRTTSRALADAVAAGLASAGIDAVRIGEVPTPALAFASVDRGGIMITASHNPPSDNGLKLFSDGVEYDGALEDAVEEEFTSEPEPVRWDDWGDRTSADVLESYGDAVRRYASRHGEGLSGLSVGVDAANGPAAKTTPGLLRALGADVATVNANVDGHFPGRKSKPTAESLSEFRAFVADSEIDVGFAHDGDGDRLVVVQPDGELLHEDTVLAILAAHFVGRSDSEDPVVVTTPNASGRIDERVAASGGRVERVALGRVHEGVATIRETTGDATSVVFAAEPWKHVHPELGDWIDGTASAAVLAGLVARAGDLETLREPVTERPYEKENVRCPEEAKAAAMSTLRESLPEAFPEATVDSSHGIRVDLQDGSWMLVRPSGTEPYLRTYVESEDVAALLETVRPIVAAAVENSQ